MWTTFSKQQATQKVLVPGEYGQTDTLTIPGITGVPLTDTGIILVDTDIVDTVRFVNLSIENKADANGNPISMYVGIGFTPTDTLYSFEWLSGDNIQGLQINGQEITAICESGQTLKINVQIANATIKIL
jgi:hypothetical protein